MDHDFNSEIGYIIECDLMYPIAIHDYTGCFPLAVGKLNVKDLKTSDY